jgi:hypothetical protein
MNGLFDKNSLHQRNGVSSEALAYHGGYRVLIGVGKAEGQVLSKPSFSTSIACWTCPSISGAIPMEVIKMPMSKIALRFLVSRLFGSTFWTVMPKISN